MNIIPETNTVVIGKENELMGTKMVVRRLNVQKYDRIPEDMDTWAKIRYKDTGAPAVIRQLGEN